MLRRSLTPHAPMDTLTVREHFACQIMAALAGRERTGSLTDMVQMAVDGADALVTALNHRQPDGRPE